MKRNRYRKAIEYDISVKNEPLPYRYPDMYLVYNAFSKTYNISLDNFILCNGCENALRIGILGANIKSITIEKPSFELVKLICDGFNIEYKEIEYVYENNLFYIPYQQIKTQALYTTDGYNNLFKHLDFNSNVFTLLDETYTARFLLDENRILKDNLIIAGSFSKAVDPGLRIGYLLFSDKWTERFNLLREEYICREAADYILKMNKIQFKHRVNNSNAICSHSVYDVFDSKPDKPYKEFVVSGKTFFRVGVGTDD